MKIFRVWSQDWSIDWRHRISRLDSAIKDIQKEPYLCISIPKGVRSELDAVQVLIKFQLARVSDIIARKGKVKHQAQLCLFLIALMNHNHNIFIKSSRVWAELTSIFA